MELEPGEHKLKYRFPMLPLGPGSYNWLVTLYDDEDLVDHWNCLPEMIVATETYQTSDDEWTGILNIPTIFSFEIADSANAIKKDR